MESWIKDDGQVIREDLKDSEFQWFGKDRKRRRGGGVGFLVRKNVQARVINSKSENLMWLVIQERLYEDTLQELQEDILRFRDKGEVGVMGDLNCRIGASSNLIATDKSEDAEVLEIPRRSEDKVLHLQGRNLLGKLNAVDMVLMNGVNNLAQYTSYQSTGNSVIDLFWVEYRSVKRVSEVIVWNHEMEILGDHRIVTMDYQW